MNDEMKQETKDPVADRRSFLAAGAIGALGALAGGDAIAQEQRPGLLSTHVLDTYNGIPAAGVRIDFFAEEGDSYVLRKSIRTNAEGRTDAPILTVDGMVVGRFQLLFHVADYFRGLGVVLPEPPFLDKVAIHFAIFDVKEHFHVPLLASPWSYVTYRGS